MPVSDRLTGQAVRRKVEGVLFSATTRTKSEFFLLMNYQAVRRNIRLYQGNVWVSGCVYGVKQSLLSLFLMYSNADPSPPPQGLTYNSEKKKARGVDF